MTIYKFFKILFMFTKHGINPFRKVEANKEKMVKRLTAKDKIWIIDNSKGCTKYYLKNMFDME